MNLNDRIDEILELLHNSWFEDDYEYDDPDGVSAKQSILKLIKDTCNEVIGEDFMYNPEYDTISKPTERCNQLRAEQRTKLDQLIGEKK